MILYGDGGYTLRCTGCEARIELSHREVGNQFACAALRESVTTTHKGCDGYGDVAKAKAAIRRERNAFHELRRRGLVGAERSKVEV